MAVFEGHQAIQFVENTKFVGWLGFVRFCCFVTINWKKKYKVMYWAQMFSEVMLSEGKVRGSARGGVKV